MVKRKRNFNVNESYAAQLAGRKCEVCKATSLETILTDVHYFNEFNETGTILLCEACLARLGGLSRLKPR